MQGRASDSDSYYSCHSTFSSCEASNTDRGGGPQDLLFEFRGQVDSSSGDEASLEGYLDLCFTLLLFFSFSFSYMDRMFLRKTIIHSFSQTASNP